MEEIEKDIVQKKTQILWKWNYESVLGQNRMDPRQWTAKKGDDVYDMTKKIFFKATTVSYLKKKKFETSRKKYESHGSESKLNYGQIWHKMKNRNIHNRNMSLWVAQRSWHWNVAHSFPIRWTRLLMYVLSANIIGVKENSLN